MILVLVVTLPLPVAMVAPAEPAGLWAGPMVSETPATLGGAQVIDADALTALIRTGALLVDSGPADRKPAAFPENAIWKPSHRTIPGAHWFPGAGRADLSDAEASRFLDRIDALTRHDKARPVITFCQPNCWGSWNVGKRLVKAGYVRVYWFREGVSGWQDRHETSPVQPDSDWAASTAP